MRTIFFTLLTLLITAVGWAQDQSSEWIDVVYLVNGSVLKGHIEKYEFGQDMEFKTMTGTHMTLPHSLIKKVEQKEYVQKKVRQAKTYAFKERGIYNTTLVELINFDPRTDQPGLGLSTVIGYQFHRLLGAGAGFAIHNYTPGNSELLYTLFAEARGFLLERNTTPFYGLGVGYGMATKRDQVVESEGGLYVSPTIGYRFGASQHGNFMLGIGWNFQQARFKYALRNWRREEIENRIQYNRFVIKLGVTF